MPKVDCALRFEPNDEGGFMVRSRRLRLSPSHGRVECGLGFGLTLSTHRGRWALPEASDTLVTTTNYIIGNDLSTWRTNVRSYSRVTYHDVRPGIDLVFHGEDGQLEYDFVLAPGARVDDAVLEVGGAAKLWIDQGGSLVIHTNNGDLRQLPPHVYQTDDDGVRHELAGTYRLSESKIAFAVPEYDHNRTLVIDPVIEYGTFLGGDNFDDVFANAVDAAGNHYLLGITQSDNFPHTGDLRPTTPMNASFVTKLDPTGTTVIYSTYFGGSAGEIPSSIAVDSTGNAYLFGKSESTDFPMVGALQPTSHGQGDCFVAKLNPSGSALIYSTYVGGSDHEWCKGIAVNSTGVAYIVGSTSSQDFPLKNPLLAAAPYTNAFVTAIDASGGTLAFSTLLGGNSGDDANSVALDSASNVYVAGETGSTDFPLKNAVQANLSGSTDAFVTKLNAGGSSLSYSTFVGGSAPDAAKGIAVDTLGGAYVVGTTYSLDFPLAAPAQPMLGGAADAFVFRLTPSGSKMVYSTYWGDPTYDEGVQLRVDDLGNAYALRSRDSSGGSWTGLTHPIVAGFNSAGEMLYDQVLADSSFANGIALDSKRHPYVVGVTTNQQFPTTPGVFQAVFPKKTKFSSAPAGFAVKLAALKPPTVSPGVTTTPPRGPIQFAVAAGTPRFTFALSTNASGGMVDATSGAYVAGPVGSVVDTLLVVDLAGLSTTATINVGPAVSVSPPTAVVGTSETLSFVASGGSNDGFVWNAPEHPSGGNVDAKTGSYTAGSVPNTIDAVEVHDSLGNRATAIVAVSARVGDADGGPDAGSHAPNAEGGCSCTTTNARDSRSPITLGAVGILLLARLRRKCRLAEVDFGAPTTRHDSELRSWGRSISDLWPPRRPYGGRLRGGL